MNLPDTVRNALTQNAAELTPIGVWFSVCTECDLPLEEAARRMEIDLHFADYSLNTRRRFFVGWQDGKYLSRRQAEPRESQFEPSAAAGSMNESSFDGAFVSVAGKHGAERWVVLRQTLPALAIAIHRKRRRQLAPASAGRATVISLRPFAVETPLHVFSAQY